MNQLNQLSLQYFLFAAFLLFPFLAAGQKNESYSTFPLSVSTNRKNDTNQVKKWDSLSFVYSSIHPDSGLWFGYKCLNLAKKLKWEEGIAVAHAGLGTNYRVKGNNKKAFHHATTALLFYKKLKNKKGVASMLSHIAMTYQVQGDYDKALEYHLKALAGMEHIKDKKSQAIINEHIGILHKEHKDYKKSYRYFTAALKLNQAIKDTGGLARNYGQLGIIYDARGDYKNALLNHQASLKINKLRGNKYGMQINFANLGIVNLHLGAIKKSLDFHKQALKLSEAIGDQSSIAINLGNVGETYLALAKKPEHHAHYKQYLLQAVKNLEQAVKTCFNIGFLPPTTEFIPYLIEAYTLSGNYKKAYEHQKQYASIKDSLFSIESKLKIESLESLRTIALKEKDIALKEQKLKIAELKLEGNRNAQLAYIFGILLLILILGLLTKRVFSYKKSNKKLKDEQALHTKTILDQDIKINNRNKILEEVAHVYSHDIRGYVATILGLSQLFNTTDYTDKINRRIIEGVNESAVLLDEVIQKVVKKQNEIEL